MKRKIKIGLWVAFAAVAIGFTTTIFNDLRNERLTVETEVLLKKTTISSFDIKFVPLDEALQTLRANAIEANPQFDKIHFDSSRVSMWEYWDDERSARSLIITLKLVDVPIVEALRYTSSLGQSYYYVDGRTIYVADLGSGSKKTTTQRIRWWIHKTKASVSDFFGNSDPIK